MPTENEHQPPVLPEGPLPFEQPPVNENEQVAKSRKEQLKKLTNNFEVALANPKVLPDGSENPDYLDPRQPLRNADNDQQKNLTEFKQLVADYRIIVLGGLQASVAPAERAQFVEQNNFVTGIEQGVIKQLEARVVELEAEENEAKIEAFYLGADKKFAELRKLAKQKDELKEKPLPVVVLRKAITDIQKLTTLVEKDKARVAPEAAAQVEEQIEVGKELYMHFGEQLLKKYQDRAVLEKVGDPALQDKTKALFAKLDQEPKELNEKDSQLVLNAVADTRAELKVYVARNFDQLIEAISIKGSDGYGADVTLFPTDTQKKLLEQFIRKEIVGIIDQLEKEYGEKLNGNIDGVINKINRITIDKIAQPIGSPEKVYYTAVLALSEELRLITSAVPVGFEAQQELLKRAKSKVEGLINEFEVRHPEYLSDDELLKLVSDRKVVPYDYSNWRLTNKNDQNLPLRSEWFARTEAYDPTKEGSDLTRARLKIQYVITEYTQRLVSGKQLSEINEDEVLPSLKNALSTRLELIKGLELAEAGINKGGASVREMMWFIAKTTARKDSDIASNELSYEKLSDLPEGSREATLKKLRQVYPDSRGYTEENRQLAVDAAILFKYLTAALLELMRFTQTGAHEYEKKVDILLIENVFKYAVHVIERYSDVEHAWGELFMFLVEVPEDWGPSDAIMERTLHNTDLIKSWYECFGDVSGFAEKLQSPGYMVPLFPNMLQLSGLRPDEAIHADGKVYGYGRTHFADVREYVVQEVNGKSVEIPIKLEKDAVIFDYDFDSTMTTPLMVIKNYDTGEVVGKKRLSRVMDGTQEVDGSFREVKEGSFEERGAFFEPASGGPLLRVLPIKADASYGVDGYLVGDFKLVDKVDPKNNMPYQEWEVDPTKHYLVVEDLQKPRYFRYKDTKNKTGAEEIPGAFVQEDEYGVWLYAADGKPIGTFKNGKIWQSNDPRNSLSGATELGYQVNAYTDNDGSEIQTTKKYSLANSGRELGSIGSSIKMNRKIAFEPDKKDIFGKSKVIIEKYGVFIEEGDVVDIFIKYGDAAKRHKRESEILADAALPPGSKPRVPKLKKRTEVGYVDISRVYAMDNEGRKLGKIDLGTGVVIRAGKVIGKLNNDNIIIGENDEAIGFGTYAVRLHDENKTHIGFIYPEVTDSKGVVIKEITPAFRAAGIDDNRRIPLDGFVNSFEKEEVARGAYQRLWEDLLSEWGPADPHTLLKSEGNKRAEFVDFFADKLGKIKMCDGPHMHMYGALSKYMIFNRMQKIALHKESGVSKEQQRKNNLAQMRGLWFEIYEMLEGTLNDTGLSGAYRFMIEDILQWMIDENNTGQGQEGMNPALTNLYWERPEGIDARIRYLDKLWDKESTSRPNPHGPDPVTGRIPGVGEGFGLKGNAWDGNWWAMREIDRAIIAARGSNNTLLANSLEKYKAQFNLEDISELDKPIIKKGAKEVKTAVAQEKEG